MLLQTAPVNIILADADSVSRRYASHAIGLDERMQIVLQVGDADCLYNAICDMPGCIVLAASALKPDLARLRMVLETTGSRGIVIAEHGEIPITYLRQGFDGVFFRNSSGHTLRKCIHLVALNHSDIDWQGHQLNPLNARPIRASGHGGITSEEHRRRHCMPFMHGGGSHWTALETARQIPASAAS
jgi:hypothetical protein